MFARDDPVLAGEVVREQDGVVGEHLLSLHERSHFETTKKVGGAGLGLVAVGANTQRVARSMATNR